MHIDQLRYLILIHHLGSINKASEQVHLSQQALNVSMKKLEDEVGYPLFIRHARGMTLTENGRILEMAAEDILERLDEALTEMQPEALPEATIPLEKLQIFSAPSLNKSFMPNIIKIFSQKHPGVQLMLMEKESKEIIQMVLNEELSALAIVTSFDTRLELAAQYHVLPIIQDKVYIIVHNSHPLAKQKTVSI